MRFGMAGVLLALFLPTFGSAQTPDTIRVCTYNILEYGDQSSDRDDELRMILNEIGPTVLFVQEISRVGGNDGYFSFLSRVINELDIRYEPMVTGWSNIPYGQVSLNLGAFVDTHIRTKVAVARFMLWNGEDFTRQIDAMLQNNGTPEAEGLDLDLD